MCFYFNLKENLITCFVTIVATNDGHFYTFLRPALHLVRQKAVQWSDDESDVLNIGGNLSRMKV